MPEPSDEERRAILSALADEEAATEGPPGYSSRWREAALLEAAADEDGCANLWRARRAPTAAPARRSPTGQATAPVRKRRGASRA